MSLGTVVLLTAADWCAHYRYFLFAASLIILSNEFALLYKNPDYESSITQTIGIMNYCAESDPQAARLLYILNSFRAVVASRRQTSADHPRAMVTSASSSYDPIASLFPDHAAITASIAKISRKNSFVGAGSANNPLNSPIGHHKATMAPPASSAAIKAPAATHENGVGGLVRTAGVSPVTSMALPNMGDSMSDQADSLGGDAEFDFDSLWNWPSMPAVVAAGPHGHPGPGGHGHAGGVGGVDGAGSAFHAVGIMGPGRFDGFGSFGGLPGTTTSEGSMGLSASVPLFAPSQY